MEEGLHIKNTYLTLKFQEFLQAEMAHVVPRQNGLPRPLPINGNYVKMLDFRFEKYLDVPLKKKLLMINSKFFAKIHGEIHSFFVSDGHDSWIANHPPSGYIELPNDWWDYAQVFFVDGTIKEPTKG